MARFHCPVGHTVPVKPVKGTMQYDPATLFCPTHQCRLETGMERNAKRKARSGGGLRQVTDAEAVARRTFSRLVCEWPCWALKHRPCSGCEGRGFIEPSGEVCALCDGDGNHHCRGRRNAHHLLPVSWLRDTYGDLDEPTFLEIAFNPLIGAPACEHNFHAALEARTDVIHFDELDPELIEFVKRLESRYPDRPSPLSRLETESPSRVEVG